MPPWSLHGAPSCLRGALAIVLVFALASPRPVMADVASSGAGAQVDAGATPPPPPPAIPRGVAVVARMGAEQAGWALAKEVYARASLRPGGLDESRARILVGDAAAPDASQALRDLADERAGIHGDDGGSRALLRAIAAQLSVRALVVVELGPSGVPAASVFLTDGGTFDAARYAADPSPSPLTSPTAPPPPVDAGADSHGSTSATLAATSDGGVAPQASVPPPPPLRWSGAVASLDRAFGSGGPETHASALAVSPLPPEVAKKSESHPFYLSPWFWGALGAAAFGGAAVYFATRDNSTQTIHLELQVPK